jgi:AcrR family transcriptional regulator
MAADHRRADWVAGMTRHYWHSVTLSTCDAMLVADRDIIRCVATNEPTLQERKQELVRAELFNAAWQLFGERGYEATTVAEIAAAAGVSRRTFFRYYASKEDVLIETTDELAEAMLAAMAERPADEPPLVAIERALAPVLQAQLAQSERLQTIIKLLRGSRTLRRAMLERHALLEERLAVQIAVRLGTDAAGDTTPALLAFIARAMMDTAFNVAHDHGRNDAAALVRELFNKLGEHTQLRASALGPTDAK